MNPAINVLSLLALLAFTAPHMLSAAEATATKAEPAKTTTEPAKPKGKYTPLYAQVESITPALLTVKGTGTDLKFVINAETKISKDKAHKEPATVADVKVGQWIGGSYTKAADGSNVLHSLHLGVNQKGEAPEAPKKK